MRNIAYKPSGPTLDKDGIERALSGLDPTHVKMLNQQAKQMKETFDVSTALKTGRLSGIGEVSILELLAALGRFINELPPEDLKAFGGPLQK